MFGASRDVVVSISGRQFNVVRWSWICCLWWPQINFDEITRKTNSIFFSISFRSIDFELLLYKSCDVRGWSRATLYLHDMRDSVKNLCLSIEWHWNTIRTVFSFSLCKISFRHLNLKCTKCRLARWFDVVLTISVFLKVMFHRKKTQFIPYRIFYL